MLKDKGRYLLTGLHFQVQFKPVILDHSVIGDPTIYSHVSLIYTRGDQKVSVITVYAFCRHALQVDFHFKHSRVDFEFQSINPFKLNILFCRA